MWAVGVGGGNGCKGMTAERKTDNWIWENQGKATATNVCEYTCRCRDDSFHSTHDQLVRVSWEENILLQIKT